MRFISVSIIIFSNLFLCQSAQAEYGLALGVGYKDHMRAYRLSIQKETCLHYGLINSYWEASANFIKYQPKNTSQNNSLNNKLYGGSLAYVLRFQQSDCENYDYCCSKKRLIPYADAGLGIALFNKNVIAQRRLGLNSLFEVKLGVGWRFGRDLEYDLSYKLIHYSNAYLAKNNDAMNFNFLVLNYWF